MRRISCGNHGMVIWRGEVVCARDLGGCGRVYRLSDDPPEKCPCGEPMKGGRAIVPICHKCFEIEKENKDEI